MQIKFFSKFFSRKLEKIKHPNSALKSDLVVQSLLNCYENEFGIDLKQIHISNTNSSANEIQLIEEINLSNRIIFSDGTDDHFKIVSYDGLNYLLGKQSVYPCSSIVNSAYGNEYNWVRCFIMPGSRQVMCQNDIRKSAIAVNFFDEFVSELADEEKFRRLIKAIEWTYKRNSWFNRNSFITNYFRKVKFWTTQEKIDNIFDEGLVSPSKYLSYLIFKDKELNTAKIIHTFNRSLSQTTLKIIPIQEFEKFIDQLTNSEIDNFFGFDYLKEQINAEILSYDFFADQLLVDMQERYGDDQYSNDVIKRIRTQETLLYNPPKSKKIFYGILKKNYRDLENHIRTEKGYDDVGSFVMERHLYNRLKNDMPQMTVIAQYSPNWLRRQRFDIFITEIDLAIEYNGIQHFKPVDFFGGEDGLKRTRNLDLLKAERARKNGVDLITINYDQDFDLRYLEIRKIIEQKLSVQF